MTNEKKVRRPLHNTYFIAIYIVFCFVVMMFGLAAMSTLIVNNTSNQINNILSLMSEKVNTSFDMMTDYITEASDMISARDGISYEESYKELQNTLKDMPYKSTGIITADGEVYGLPGEKLDMEKQDIISKIEDSDGIVITEPYRSSVTGSNMITMFSPVYKNGRKMGYIFITYYLETIQNLAYTNILSDETAVLLMNPFSGNFVNCSASDGNPPGTWSNIRLIKADITPFEDYDYDEWLKNMRKGAKENIINFRQNGVSYTQAYIDIEGMENWDLVIRIPITELSDAMRRFTVAIAATAALLILATMLLAAVLYNREHEQNETLQTLTDIDPLTKVINRRGFENRLQELREERADTQRQTFMFFDIDYFKEVNDNYGHSAGDLVLCKVADLLSESFRDTGIVARIGGDEFNVMIYEPLSEADIDSIMANMRACLKDTVLEDGTPLPVTFSAGLAVYPQDASDLYELRECADKALYNGKENGRNNHSWYKDMNKN